MIAQKAPRSQARYIPWALGWASRLQRQAPVAELTFSSNAAPPLALAPALTTPAGRAALDCSRTLDLDLELIWCPVALGTA